MTQLLPSALSNSLVFTLGLIVLFFVLRYLLLYLSSDKPLIYYLILFPGVIIHELSHVIFCLITFTRIKSLKLFSKSGGFVIHNKPRWLWVSFIISVAPILVGSVILFITMRYFSNQTILSALNIKSLFLLYFLSSIVITMLPSKQDFLNAASVYIAIFIAIICYYFLSDNKIFFVQLNTLIVFGCLILLVINLLFYSLRKVVWK